MTGQVVDSDDDPVANVSVLPLLGDRPNSGEALVRSRAILGRGANSPSTRTGSSGAFLLHGVPEGQLQLFVDPPKDPSFIVSNVAAGAKGLKIVIPSMDAQGEDSGVRFLISVFGRDSFAPISGAKVYVVRLFDDGSGIVLSESTHVTSSEGKAEFWLSTEGRYRIMAWADGFEQTLVDDQLYPSGTYSVQIPMPKNGELRVQVKDREGNPIPGMVLYAVNHCLLYTSPSPRDRG